MAPVCAARSIVATTVSAAREFHSPGRVPCCGFVGPPQGSLFERREGITRIVGANEGLKLPLNAGRGF
jgi:hypothetical protein